MLAANHEEIEIAGATLIRLSGTDIRGKMHTAPIMVYVSPSTKKFYISREALIQLHVIDRDFPKVGATMISSLECEKAP